MNVRRVPRLVFRCKLCGKEFVESEWDEEIDPKNIGKYSHIISTHECGNESFGCAELLGFRKDYEYLSR